MFHVKRFWQFSSGERNTNWVTRGGPAAAPALRPPSFQSAPSEIPSSNIGGGLGWRTKRAAQISVPPVRIAQLLAPSSPRPVRERSTRVFARRVRVLVQRAILFARDSRFCLRVCCPRVIQSEAKNPGFFSSPRPVRERIEGEGPCLARVHFARDVRFCSWVGR
jgi:hypothetical protein